MPTLPYKNFDYYRRYFITVDQVSTVHQDSRTINLYLLYACFLAYFGPSSIETTDRPFWCLWGALSLGSLVCDSVSSWHPREFLALLCLAFAERFGGDIAFPYWLPSSFRAGSGRWSFAP
ncbi:hypothetical protein TYRP_023309 [Tyrophagus putrescentiae]|nr:hypothetical protein TYRP_023309 [Tyrophagus putrescentiae]